MADPYAAALGLKAPTGNPAAGSAILSPADQASSDAMERGPTGKDGFELAYINATPAQRLEMERSLRLAGKAPSAPSAAANDPYAAALGLGAPEAKPFAGPKTTALMNAPKSGAEALPEEGTPEHQARRKNNNALVGNVIQGVTGAGASVIGGWRGLSTLVGGLAAGDDLKTSLSDAANEAEHEISARTITPAAGSDAAVVGESKLNPMNWPAAIGGAAGNKVNDITGSPALATAVDVGAQFAAPLGAAKLARVPLRSIGKPAPVAPRVEPTLEGAPAPAVTNQPPTTIPQATAVPQMAPAAQGAAPSSVATAVSGLEKAPPELQQAVAKAQAKGAPIDPSVLQRHVDAQTLPVPLQLTEGQATLNPELISREMNGRGKERPAVSPDFYNAQGKSLVANVDAVRASVAPDIPVTDKTSLGQSLVDAYKAKDAPIVADIDAKYQALRDANGGDFPVDAQGLLTNIRTALKKELVTKDAPASQMSEIERMAEEGSMSFEDFLSLRRNLGNVARTATDGNTRVAASAMIEQLEALPLKGGAEQLKPMADAARGAARARFKALDADPAYKAAVGDGIPAGEPSPLADKFSDSYIIRAPYANVKQMKASLANDPAATQAMAAAAVEHLRGLAKADPQTGNFSQAGWNTGVKALGQKLDETLGDHAPTVRKIGEVAKLTQAQPKGSYVNNSNTLVGTLSEAGKSSLEGAANVFAGGVPVGTWARKGVQAAAANKAAKKATAPGAGMTNLSDVGKPKP